MKSFSLISLFFLAITALALPQPKPATDDTIAAPLERKNFEPGYKNEGSWSLEPPAHGKPEHNPLPVPAPKATPTMKDNNDWVIPGNGHDWQPSKSTLSATSTTKTGWPQQSSHSQSSTWTTIAKPSHWQPEPPKTTAKPSWSSVQPGKSTTSSEPITMTVPAGWDWEKHNGWKRSEGVDGWVVEHLIGA